MHGQDPIGCSGVHGVFTAERSDRLWVADITYVPTLGRLSVPGCHR